MFEDNPFSAGYEGIAIGNKDAEICHFSLADIGIYDGHANIYLSILPNIFKRTATAYINKYYLYIDAVTAFVEDMSPSLDNVPKRYLSNYTIDNKFKNNFCIINAFYCGDEYTNSNKVALEYNGFRVSYGASSGIPNNVVRLEDLFSKFSTVFVRVYDTLSAESSNLMQLDINSLTCTSSIYYTGNDFAWFHSYSFTPSDNFYFTLNTNTFKFSITEY